MKLIKTTLIILFYALLMPLTAQKLVIDEVIAVVGNTPILRSELDVAISQVDPDIVVTREIKCNIMKKLVMDKMLLHQAELDSISITDQEVEDKMDNSLRFFERQMNNRAALEKYLGMSVAEYKKMMHQKVKNQMLIERMGYQIQSNVKTTPKEVKAYYKSMPEDSLPFISAEVEVAQILIYPDFNTESKELALEKITFLRDRILKGESFARLASLYTEDPGSKKTGGLLPEFGRNEMVPEFERMAFTMKKDSISPVIQTKYGYHILRLEDRRGDRAIVRHILVRPQIFEQDLEKAKLKLDSIKQLLENNKITICNAAKTYSQDEETKLTCGFFTDPNLGTQKIPYDYLDKELSAIVTSLKPGQYSEPFKGYAPDGNAYYRIIYLKSESKPHVANLEQDWQRIQLLALEQKRTKELEKWTQLKIKNVYIYLNPHYLYCPFYSEWTENN